MNISIVLWVCGMIEFKDHITRELVQTEKHKLFVFGDNVVRRGSGGQAREMRGEPNAIGIITKFYPSMTDSSFLNDSFYKRWLELSANDILQLFLFPYIVVWPRMGIGTGLAYLPEKAPKIFRTIELIKLKLEMTD